MLAAEKAMAIGQSKKGGACVTGGNGFVASSLVKLLLESGYAVHATVRDPEATAKVAHLKALQSLGELKLFRADLTAEGSFDEAVAGCDYVFLVASPVDLMSDDPENDLIRPASEGTVNVLRSCSKAAVKRVVLTSSAAAVSGVRFDGSDVVADESSWTDVGYLCEARPPTWGYLVAKTLAEKAAWKYAGDNKLDLVAVNPPLIVGPTLTPAVPFSVRLAVALLTGEEVPVLGIKIMQQVSGSISFVHVEDVCRAQLFLAETPSAAGRYILNAANSCLSELSKFLAERYPHRKVVANLEDVPAKGTVSLSSEKLVKEGFEFKHDNLEAIFDEVVRLSEAAGLLQKAAVE